jgi:AraC family transcriptional regulator
MLTNLPATNVVSPVRPLRSSSHADVVLSMHPSAGKRRTVPIRGTDAGLIGQSAVDGIPTVEVSPVDIVSRRAIAWRGMTAEIIQAARRERVEYRYRAPVHLLAVYDQGVRLDGDTFVEGLPRSSLRDLKKKLTFVPAGHEYQERHEPRVLTRIIYFYFDPGTVPTHEQMGQAQLAPRLYFEDGTLWDTAIKLATLVESAGADNRLYLQALGVVLTHELARLDPATPRVQQRTRGGLAAWQQRIVTAYVEEHLAEQISLATLAQLARLSPFYFCRAFKQSLGIPPHRYHTSRRIERAKVLLARPGASVTEVGMEIGFSETSSFTAAFRKATGLTPRSFQRSHA